MSTPAQHNDDMFRQRLEDYREMPSDKVWAGVERALDQKKKRRFLFWIWFPGTGMAAAAAIFIPLLLNVNPGQHEAGRAVRHISPIVGLPSVTLSADNTQASSAGVHHTSDPASPARATQPNISQAHITQTPREPGTHRHGSRHVPSAQAKQTTGATAQTDDVKNTAGTNGETPQTQTPEIPPAGNMTRTPLAEITLPRVGGERIKNDFAFTPTPITAQALYVGLTHLKPVLTFGPTSRFQPFVSVQGYAGGVAYHRTSPDKTKPSPAEYANMDTVNRSKRFGFYGSAVAKAGFVFNRSLYVAVGVGYETQHFSDSYQFLIPGTGSLPTNDTTSSIGEPATDVLTNFGPVNIPLENTVGSGTSATAQKLNGKLVYQSQHLIFPVEIGYRFSRRRLGFSIVGSAAFHVPLAQSAIFYPDKGDPRTVTTNPFARFNVSVGLEPSIECFITPRISFLAGGSFRYQLLNAFRTNPGAPPYISRPYTLSGQMGLRFYLGK